MSNEVGKLLCLHVGEWRLGAQELSGFRQFHVLPPPLWWLPTLSRLARTFQEYGSDPRSYATEFWILAKSEVPSSRAGILSIQALVQRPASLELRSPAERCSPGGLVAPVSPLPSSSCHSMPVLCHFRKKQLTSWWEKSISYQGAHPNLYLSKKWSFCPSYIWLIRGPWTCHISIIKYIIIISIIKYLTIFIIAIHYLKILTKHFHTIKCFILFNSDFWKIKTGAEGQGGWNKYKWVTFINCRKSGKWHTDQTDTHGGPLRRAGPSWSTREGARGLGGDRGWPGRAGAPGQVADGHIPLWTCLQTCPDEHLQELWTVHDAEENDTQGLLWEPTAERRPRSFT